MSNLVDNFKNDKVKNLTNSHLKALILTNNNYNIEIGYVNRLRINSRQKQITINNINKKYEQIRANLKLFFENEIKKANNISQSTISSLNSGLTNKKALIIGINYIGTSSRLNGCINDAKSIESYLKENNFTNIKMLTDETIIKPTKINILNFYKN